MDVNNPNTPVREGSSDQGGAVTVEEDMSGILSDISQLSMEDGESEDEISDSDFKKFMMKQVRGINKNVSQLHSKFDRLQTKVKYWKGT
jgi:hypothetical protein